MKIKDKTKLRQLVLQKKDTVGEYDKIFFWENGDWSCEGQATIRLDAIASVSVRDILYRWRERRDTINKAIGKAIRQIQQIINSGRADLL